MPFPKRNLEIKARVADRERIRELATKLASRPPERIEQEDTFFPAAQGRLKLRLLGDGGGELIGYERRDGYEPGESRYAVVPTSRPRELVDVLGRALGVRGVVRKRREVFHVGATRVHVDEVEGLGSFVELEVVLGPGDSTESGERRARELMRELEIRAEDLVDVAYIDLLSR